MKTFLILLMTAGVACGQPFFTWPMNTANYGPYLLIGDFNVVAYFPNSNFATENDLSSQKYNHHTRIAFYNGVTFIAHSSGPTNEDTQGQATVINYSKDNGKTWSAPVLVCPCQSTYMDTNYVPGERVTYPRSFVQTNGNLYLVVAVDQWSAIGQQIGAALVGAQIFANGTVGTLYNVSPSNYVAIDGKAMIPYDVTTASLTYNSAKIFGPWGGNYPSIIGPSDWPGFSTDLGDRWVEPQTFSIDGTALNLHRIWRHDGGAFSNFLLGEQDSVNGGVTFTTMTQSNTVPNAPSEVTAIRLTDGRTAIIGNALLYTNNSIIYARDPLYLGLTSANTLTITNVYAVRQGVTQGSFYSSQNNGGCQYPGAVQVGNYIYISYSIHKESIGFSRVPIPDLANNNNDGFIATVLTGNSTLVGNSFLQ